MCNISPLCKETCVQERYVNETHIVHGCGRAVGDSGTVADGKKLFLSPEVLVLMDRSLLPEGGGQNQSMTWTGGVGYDLTCTPHSPGAVQVARPTTFLSSAVAELYQMVMQEAGIGLDVGGVELYYHRKLHPPQLTKFLEEAFRRLALVYTLQPCSTGSLQ